MFFLFSRLVSICSAHVVKLIKMSSFSLEFFAFTCAFFFPSMSVVLFTLWRNSSVRAFNYMQNCWKLNGLKHRRRPWIYIIRLYRLLHRVYGEWNEICKWYCTVWVRNNYVRGGLLFLFEHLPHNIYMQGPSAAHQWKAWKSFAGLKFIIDTSC